MVAFQLAGRATRDALYLSTFPTTTLPRMILGSSAVAAFVCITVAHRMARVGPARLVPGLFLGSALLLLAEWWLARVARPLAAIALYLHFSALGALVVSGFWAIVNERFDPRTARRAIARITVGATVGGLLGGILPERAGAVLPLTAMFPILAGLHALSALLVLGVLPRAADAAGAAPAALEEEAPGSARQAFRRSPYLRGLVLLVVLTVMAEGLLDFVFKVRATAATASGEELLRLFARFYTATALLGVVVQLVALRPVLARLGVARTASLLPAGVAAGAVGGLFLPGLTPILAARGGEIVLRNSFFRGAYELFFTPVGAREKRATKLLVDVGASRLGDAAGAGLIQATLGMGAAAAAQWLLAGVIALSAGAGLVARRLHRGYVEALEQSLKRRVEQMPGYEPTRTATLLQTLGGFDLDPARPDAFAHRASPPAATTESQEIGAEAGREALRLRALDRTDPGVVLEALAEGPLNAAMVERAIGLLAWDAVAPAARRALEGAAPAATDPLVRHLLEPSEDFAIRRRLVAVLGSCPTPHAVLGLTGALEDRRFEVRYRAGRALLRLRRSDPALAVDSAAILAAVEREVNVERGVWDGRRLVDEDLDPWGEEDAERVRVRADRSMEHVFNLLALVLPREPVRLAFHGLHTDDAQIRGTALEYLESVLPQRVRDGLWPFLEPGRLRTGKAARSGEEALANLLASRDTIVATLAARDRGAAER